MSSSTTVEEDDMCTVCRKFKINSIFQECGHMLTCYECGKPMTKCPVCQQDSKGCVNMDDVKDDEPPNLEDLKEYLQTAGVPWMNAPMPVNRPSSNSQVQKQKEDVESLSDILSEDVIATLTSRQLKSFLKSDANKFCEKHELIAEVKARWREMKENVINDQSPGQEEKSDYLCRICQKEEVDSMFSDCGHMVCCFSCGQNADHCPICQKEKPQVFNMRDLYNEMYLEDHQAPAAQSENDKSEEDDVDFTWEEGVCHECKKQGIDYIFPDCGHMVLCKKCKENNNSCPICPQIQIIPA